MRRAGLVVIVGLMGACEPAPPRIDPGLDLALRVQRAGLRRGPLPPDEGGPAVTQVLRPQPAVLRGEATVELDGRLAPGGISLLLSAAGDDAHWVVAPAGFDFVITDELLWHAQLDFAHHIPGERLRVDAQAVDERGRGGPVTPIEFSLLPDVPPSELSISLGWDSAVDLDLHVEAPDGTIVGPKNPNTVEFPPGVVPPPDAWMDGGVYAFDSNQQCRFDLRNREDVVWFSPPPAGTYRVYAHLFSPCDQAAVNFRVTVMRGTEVIEEAVATQYAFDARLHPKPGEAPGLLMLEVEIP